MMLRLENVAVTFNPGTALEVAALCGVSLAVPAGQFVTVIGSNGAGEAVAFDLGTPEPYTVVAFDMSNGEQGEGVQPMAESFDRMLELIGYDEELT